MRGVEDKAKRTNLQKIMLGMIAAADAMDEIAASGRMLVVMRRMGLAPKKRQLEFIKLARKRLLEKGLLERKNGKLELTDNGKKKYQELLLQEIQISKPKRWDGRWRILIFDVPESRKNTRDELRNTLDRIGFMPLQKSVWIYPYDCESLIILLKTTLRIGYEVLYLVVDGLENDTPFKEVFNLPIKEAIR